jgi:hypothetical protein
MSSGSTRPGEAVAPRRQVIDPAGERIFPTPDARHIELGGPEIVAERLHRHIAPVLVTGPAVAHRAGDSLVAVRIAGGGHDHVLADHALHGEAPAIDLRLDLSMTVVGGAVSGFFAVMSRFRA